MVIFITQIDRATDLRERNDDLLGKMKRCLEHKIVLPQAVRQVAIKSGVHRNVGPALVSLVTSVPELLTSPVVVRSVADDMRIGNLARLERRVLVIRLNALTWLATDFNRK